MKVKTKSNKGQLTTNGRKSQKKLNQTKLNKSVSKKTQVQVRKNLQNTFKLLQCRLNIKQQQKHNNTLVGLSQSIYEIIQKNIPQRPKMSGVATQDSSQQSSTAPIKSKDRQRSYSSHSSSIMQYFKQKFGENTNDEQGVQKKLKALQALKRSQQLVTKYSSQYNNSTCSIPDIGCDVNTKQIVAGKLKKKHNQ